MLVGCRVDLAPGAAAADADGAGLRVDLDRLQRREVDHDAVVDGAEAAAVVAAAADRQRQVVLGGEADRPSRRRRGSRSGRSAPGCGRSSRCRRGSPRRSRRRRGRSARPRNRSALGARPRRVWWSCSCSPFSSGFQRRPGSTLSARPGPVMTRVDPFLARPRRRSRARIVRPDYGGHGAMHELSGSLGLASTLPFVGRTAELETLRALLPRAEGEGRRVVLVGGEAGLRQEPAGAGVRRRGRGRRRARALRRLRRDGPDPLRTVRRGARPARPGHRARRAARRARHRGWRAHPPGPRSDGPGRRAAATGRRRPRHRAPPPAHGGDRPADRGRRRAAAAPGARGRSLGRRAHPAAAPPPRPRRRGRPAAGGRDLPRHRGRPPGRRSRRRSPTCGAPTTSSACASSASRPTR